MNKKNCILITSHKENTIPIQFDEKYYSFEIVRDEKEALNKIKVKNIDIAIINGSLEYLNEDELFSIILERTDINNKDIIVIQIKERSGNNFEIRTVNKKSKKYIAAFLTEKEEINLNKILSF